MKIREVVESTGFPASTLRFYEQKGLIRNIDRGADGKRDFSEDDLKWIKFLASIKIAGMSVDEMMPYAELYYSGNENLEDRIAVTEKYRDKLLEEMKQLQEAIQFLDDKIEYYYDLKERKAHKRNKGQE